MMSCDDLSRNRESFGEHTSHNDCAVATSSEYADGNDKDMPKSNILSSMDLSTISDSLPNPSITDTLIFSTPAITSPASPESTPLQPASLPNSFLINASAGATSSTFVFGAPSDSPFAFGSSSGGLNKAESSFCNTASQGSTFTFGGLPAFTSVAFGVPASGGLGCSGTTVSQNGANIGEGSGTFVFSPPAVGRFEFGGTQLRAGNLFGATITTDQQGLAKGGSDTKKHSNNKKTHASTKTCGGISTTDAKSLPSFSWSLDASKLQSNDSSMLSIRKINVPVYLHKSEFYQSLQDDEGEEISVPRDCMKINNTVTNNADLRSLLLTLRFWVAGCFCDPLLNYVGARPAEEIEDTLSEFYQDFPALKHVKAVVTSRTPMVPAIESGELELVNFCLQRGQTWPALPFDKIAKVGNVEMMKLALQAGCKMTQRATELAAGNGQLDCLRFLHENGAVWNRGTVTAAVDGGHLNCLQYAHQQGLPLSSKLYAYAVDANSLDIVKYLCENDVLWEDTKACETAAASGKIEFLKYMYENGSAWDSSVCAAAAKNHQLETVLYLLRNDSFPSGNIWDFTGDAFQQILQCFLEVELPWSAASQATLLMVETGNLEGLASLVDSGCPWHPATTTRLAQTNNLEMLKLAHEKGCPWNSNTCAQAKSIELLTYAHTHGAPIPANTLLAMLEPASETPRDVLFECFKYVYLQGGCPLDRSLTYCAARDGSLELLKYLYEQGCAWESDAPFIAAQHSHAECLDYILSRGGALSAEVLSMDIFGRDKSCLDVIKKHTDGCPVHILEEPSAAIHRRVLHLLRNGLPAVKSLWDITNDEFCGVVKSFLEAGPSWSAFPEAMLHVIEAGNFAGLKCLVENGCPWHQQTTSYIARINNLTMLQYVHERGCPWCDATCTKAAFSGSLECLEFAHTHGAVIGQYLCSRLLSSDSIPPNSVSLECFKYAHQRGGSLLFGDHTCYAASRGELDVLKYLHEQGCEWDSRAAAAAERHGHNDCLSYIMSHGGSFPEGEPP